MFLILLLLLILLYQLSTLCICFEFQLFIENEISRLNLLQNCTSSHKTILVIWDKFVSLLKIYLSFCLGVRLKKRIESLSLSRRYYCLWFILIIVLFCSWEITFTYRQSITHFNQFIKDHSVYSACSCTNFVKSHTDILPLLIVAITALRVAPKEYILSTGTCANYLTNFKCLSRATIFYWFATITTVFNL